MKNGLKKLVVLGVFLLSLTFFTGCDIFKINLTPPENTPSYTIQVTVSEGGVVTGAGSYEKNETVTLTATPNVGYQFLNWTTNAVVVHTEASYTFPATQNVVLYANFVRITGTYYLNNDTTFLVLSLEEDESYTYETYTKNSGKYTLTQEVGTYTLTQDELTLTSAEEQVTTYSFTFQNNVFGLNDGQTVLSFSKNSGNTPDIFYNFRLYFEGQLLEVEFFEDGTAIRKTTNQIEVVEENYTYVLLDDYVILINLELEQIFIHNYELSETVLYLDEDAMYREDVDIMIDVTTSSEYMQYVTGFGTYYINERVTLQVESRINYTFVGWRIGATMVSNNPIYTFIATEDVTVTPVWLKDGIGIEPAPY
jgi:hypothetical protein